MFLLLVYLLFCGSSQVPAGASTASSQHRRGGGRGRPTTRDCKLGRLDVELTWMMLDNVGVLLVQGMADSVETACHFSGAKSEYFGPPLVSGLMDGLSNLKFSSHGLGWFEHLTEAQSVLNWRECSSLESFAPQPTLEWRIYHGHPRTLHVDVFSALQLAATLTFVEPFQPTYQQGEVKCCWYFKMGDLVSL